MRPLKHLSNHRILPFSGGKMPLMLCNHRLIWTAQNWLLPSQDFWYFLFEINILLYEFLEQLSYPLIWTASSEFGTYRLWEQRRFRRACASAQSRQNLRCSLIQAVCQEEPSDRKPDPWPLWMAGHAQLKFVMTECSKTQIRFAGLIWAASWQWSSFWSFVEWTLNP